MMAKKSGDFGASPEIALQIDSGGSLGISEVTALMMPPEDEPEAEEAEEEAPEAEAPVALTPADLADALDKMLPGIGAAIDKRLTPLVEQVATLEAQVKSLAAEEAAKVKAVLDGGSLFDRMWSDKNSVQRRKTVTDTGPEETKGTAAMNFAARYGPDAG